MSRTRLLPVALLSVLAGCYSSSSPRFSHVEVEGPEPYVFFDQKTQQLCWGSASPDHVAGTPVTIQIRVHESDLQNYDPSRRPATYTTMPVCKDLK